MPKWLRPTGGFGIGMQSGFMIVDEIQIESCCEDDVKGRSPLLEEMLSKLYSSKTSREKTDAYLMYYNGKVKTDDKHMKQEDVFIVKHGQRQIYATDENYFAKLHVSKIPFYTEERQEKLRKEGGNLIISPVPALYSDNDSLFSLKNIDDPEKTYFKRITDNKMYPSLIDWVFDHQKVLGLYNKDEIKEEYDRFVRFIFSTYIKKELERDM